ILIGLATEVARKLLKNNRRYQSFSTRSQAGKTTDFLIDSLLLPSPYASSFGGFVELLTAVWFGAGGVIASLYDIVTRRPEPADAKPAEGEVPSDMSTMSLLGGGLIAGDSLAALSIGIYGLLKTIL
ncbi:MAG TPA: peptide transporter, partial [Candidatus Paceibacterota bacterium]|nr:peptide transporter [Candidatus Paceibacterota bacterium]